MTSAIPYRQPDSEDLLGSFFVELNELPKTQNLRVKGIKQQRFTVSESYYTLYDQQKDQVSKDRLALKLYLLDNGKSLSFVFELLLCLQTTRKRCRSWTTCSTTSTGPPSKTKS